MHSCKKEEKGARGDEHFLYKYMCYRHRNLEAIYIYIEQANSNRPARACDLPYRNKRIIQVSNGYKSCLIESYNQRFVPNS